ncbi:hypothetical protein GCM10011490_05280 [Pseudoclavibacter endophyticus]|nr:hypothetical protein GCM10011490_05280 [Pseudoclavibacter endophyticus]
MTDHRSTSVPFAFAGRPVVRRATVVTLAAGVLAAAATCLPAPAQASTGSAPGGAATRTTTDGALDYLVQWPLETGDATLTSGFGWRVSPCAGCSSNHRGLDFAAPTGTPIGAIADGVVTEAMYTDGGGLGLHVVVEHEIDGHNVTSVYGHLDYQSITVEVGDEVRAGERLGSVGNTGASTGPHLHLETIVDGVHRDPLAFLLRYADGADVEITDRPSLPWLPAAPADEPAAPPITELPAVDAATELLNAPIEVAVQPGGSTGMGGGVGDGAGASESGLGDPGTAPAAPEAPADGTGLGGGPQAPADGDDGAGATAGLTGA